MQTEKILVTKGASFHPNGFGMPAGSEILIQAADRNLRIKEVPIHDQCEVEDASTEHLFAHGVKELYDIIALIGYRRPLFALGIPRALLLSFSRWLWLSGRSPSITPPHGSRSCSLWEVRCS